MRKRNSFRYMLYFIIAIIIGIFAYNLIGGSSSFDEDGDTIKEKEIMLEGAPIKIRTKTYVSSIGYKVDYDIDIFNITTVNDELRFMFKENSDIYVGIKEVPTREIERDNIKFISKHGLTLRIRTNCNQTSSEYVEGILARINNLIDSIEITK